MKSDGVSEEFEETKGAIRIREMLRSCKWKWRNVLSSAPPHVLKSKFRVGICTECISAFHLR
jgi:hypothetical protein